MAKKVMKAIADDLAEADKSWMGFRAWIAKNPLTGFWAGVGAGAAIGALVMIAVLV